MKKIETYLKGGEQAVRFARTSSKVRKLPWLQISPVESNISQQNLYHTFIIPVTAVKQQKFT